MAKKKHHGTGPTRAVEELTQAGVNFTPLHYEHHASAASYGGEAADQLDLPAQQVFKTLMVETSDGEFVVAAIPVDHHLSLKLIARAAGARSAKMADPAVAQRRTGYVVGGISPLGQTTRHRAFIDESALAYDAIAVSGGKRGFSVLVATTDLAELTEGEFAPLIALD